MTVVQRLYPTDPSRSIDFSAVEDPGKGATGAGSQKKALAEAEAARLTWHDLGLPEAPHFMESDGSVKVRQISGRAREHVF